MYEIMKASRDCPLYKTLIQMRKGDYITLTPQDVQNLGETGLSQAIMAAEDDSSFDFERVYRVNKLQIWCV